MTGNLIYPSISLSIFGTLVSPARRMKYLRYKIRYQTDRCWANCTFNALAVDIKIVQIGFPIGEVCANDGEVI